MFDQAATTIVEYSSGSRLTPMRLPTQLTRAHRATLHEIAARCGLDHHSEGDTKDQRCLVISRRKGVYGVGCRRDSVFTGM